MAYSFTNYTPFSHMGNVRNYFQQSTSPFQRGYYNDATDIGYQRFLDRLPLGVSQQQTMQALYDQILRQWKVKQAQDFGTHNQPVDWLRFLTNNVNWKQQFARLDPQQRHENPGNFMRPVRVLNFL